jgi:hypothetical protein
MNGPRTPAEFRCFALKALPDSDVLTIAALDEVVATIERVYVGEQLEPTPCQAFMGRVFLDAIEEYLVQPKPVDEFMTIGLVGFNDD